MPHSFYFGGTADDPSGSEMTYLGGPDYRITVPMESLPLLLSSLVDVQDGAYSYGGASWGSHFESKLIRVPCIMQSDNFQDALDKMGNVNYLLNKTRLSALRFDDLPDRYWLVRLQRAGSASLMQMGSQFDLEFVAPDPRAYSVNLTTQTVNIDSDPESFTVPASGVVGGSIEPDVTWLLKPSGTGATSPVILTNTTRDEALTWASTLTSSEWLRLTIAQGKERAEKTTDSGASYSPSMALQSGSRFPRISAGVANSCSISGVASTGTLEISYRERFA